MTQARTKLTIISEPDIKDIGDKGAKKCSFQANDPEGRALYYFTFTQKFFSYLKKDAVIDVDVDTTERTYQDTQYIDRKIVQLYINGEPVAAAGGGKGGGWRGKSPEELDLERYRNRSIEAQTCLKEAVNYLPRESEIAPSQVVEVARVFLSFIDEAHGTKPSPQNPASKTTPSTIIPEESQEGQKTHTEPPSDTFEMYIDLDWLKEQLALFQSKGLAQWSNVMVVESLNVITGRRALSVREAVSYLTKEQADAFVIKVLETAKTI